MERCLATAAAPLDDPELAVLGILVEGIVVEQGAAPRGVPVRDVLGEVDPAGRQPVEEGRQLLVLGHQPCAGHERERQ